MRAFLTGVNRNMHKARKMAAQKHSQKGDKAIVLGMLERKGRVRATVISDRKKPSIEPHVAANVADGSTIHTDEFSSGWYGDKKFVHNVINHAEEYVNGNVHTNGIENFWSLLKRGLGGTYVSVEPFHLYRYIDEQAFRYNTRKDTQREHHQHHQRLSPLHDGVVSDLSDRWEAVDVQTVDREGGGSLRGLLVGRGGGSGRLRLWAALTGIECGLFFVLNFASKDIRAGN